MSQRKLGLRLKSLFRPGEPRPPPSQPLAQPSAENRPQASPPLDTSNETPWKNDTLGSSSTSQTQAPAHAPTIGKGQKYGIKILYDGGDTAAIDIVFVHGLTGNAYNTWFHKDAGVHWPSQLLSKDMPDTRILSFGYDADIVNLWDPASVNTLANHAENMVGDLVRKRERTDTEARPIVFVTHSLGGLVTEHALSYSRRTVEKHLRQIEYCTHGLIFLGVPHCGSDLAAWGHFGSQVASILKRTNKDILSVLKPGSEMLRQVQQGFHNILRLRKDEGTELEITSFYEELPVTGVGVVRLAMSTRAEYADVVRLYLFIQRK